MVPPLDPPLGLHKPTRSAKCIESCGNNVHQNHFKPGMPTERVVPVYLITIIFGLKDWLINNYCMDLAIK